MDEVQLNDLKQFITAIVLQATADVATKGDIARLEKKFEKRIDDLDLKIDTISVALNEHLNEHGARLTRLEQQQAV